MNGTLAQLLSLISYGNQYMKAEKLPAFYYPDNAAFKFCNQVNFCYLAAKAGDAPETEVAATPPDWFDLLKRQGCRMLKAYYHLSKGNELGTPDHQLAGFVGGGGTWLIEAIYDHY